MRAVRMVAECRHEHGSEWATIESVADKLGIGTAQTLHSWVRRDQVDSGGRAGLTSGMAAEMRKLRARASGRGLRAGVRCAHSLPSKVVPGVYHTG